MKKPISATERCNLFEEISVEIWRRLIEAHDVKMDIPEVGVTADIIIDILKFSKYQIGNFDVYAKKGWSENVYGSDLEIFIETSPNDYVMYALQAKILKKNNRYDTLRDNSDGIMQWDKLTLLEAVTGCKSFYILYNGREQFQYSGRDSCNRDFDEKQFGCSLVEPNDIANFARQKYKNGYYKNPTFEDIHPQYAQPWRILTCCLSDKQKLELYNIEEIIPSNPFLVNIEKEEVEKDSRRFDNDGDFSFLPPVENNRLNAMFREAKWNPDLRIIIKRTDRLEF